MDTSYLPWAVCHGPCAMRMCHAHVPFACAIRVCHVGGGSVVVGLMYFALSGNSSIRIGLGALELCFLGGVGPFKSLR